MTVTDVARWAEALAEARRAGRAAELNSDLAGLDGKTAYAIQREGFRARGEGPVAGYKIGWADAAARARSGVPEPIFGRFAPSDVLRGGTAHSLDLKLKPGIEGELVFHVERALPVAPGQPVLAAALLAACSIGVGFDLMDSRLVGGAGSWTAAVADNCGAGAVCLGSDRIPLSEAGPELPGQIRLTLWRDGEPVDAGSAEKLGGDPLQLVAWLANKLAAEGEGLMAGQFIFTGAMAGPQWLEAPGEWEIRSMSLGRARVQVTGGNGAAE